MRKKICFLLMVALYASVEGGGIAFGIENPEPEIADDAFL